MRTETDAPILKNLNAVMVFSSARYQNEYIWQDIQLSERFKRLYEEYLDHRHYSISYNEHTSIITTSKNQYLFIDNQWFAIASYFVDYCTELLTYQAYFNRICDYLGKGGLDYATKLRTNASGQEKQAFMNAAMILLKEDFPYRSDISLAASYLWTFATDYKWWHGRKTINRHDFYYSAILNLLNIVNNSHEFVADIVYAFASDYELRRCVESIDGFTIDAQINDYTPKNIEVEAYKEAEAETDLEEGHSKLVISISAASLERFKAGK